MYAPDFVLGAKSQMCLAPARDLVRNCTTSGRELSVANIRRNTAIRNFHNQWKALKDHRKDEEMKAPKNRKTLSAMK